MAMDAILRLGEAATKATEALLDARGLVGPFIDHDDACASGSDWEPGCTCGAAYSNRVRSKINTALWMLGNVSDG